jgi:hypothetical protein
MTGMQKNYGRTLSGKPITDELIEKIVREAEEGWDVEKILARQELDHGSKPASGEGDQTSPSRRSHRRR